MMNKTADMKKYMREYNQKRANDKGYLMRLARTNANFRNRHKKAVFDHYGWQCNCCGENNPLFLTIDHVNNDGHREVNGKGNRISSIALIRKIIKNDFPSIYQILCWNCNHGKHLNKGICPHTA